MEGFDNLAKNASGVAYSSGPMIEAPTSLNDVNLGTSNSGANASFLFHLLSGEKYGIYKVIVYATASSSNVSIAGWKVKLYILSPTSRRADK